MELTLSKGSRYKRLLTPLLFIITALFLSTHVTAEETVHSTKPSQVSPEQIEVSKAFAAALNSQDVDTIANFFDMSAFGDLVLAQMETERNIKNALAQQYKTPAFARTFAQSSFILPPNSPANFDYKGLVKTDLFGVRPLIRLDYLSGGHEFMLIFFDADNKIIDLFYATKGNLTSKSVASTTQMILPAQNRFVARLLKEDDDAEKAIESFQKMLALRQQGRFQEVLDILSTLPETMRSSRSLIDFEVLIAQNVGEAEYIEALSKLNKYYGDDPSTSFMLVDYHVTVEQNEAAMRSVEQAMAFWGEDAALYNLKANMYFLLDDLNAAIGAAKKAVQLEPEFEDSYWTLVALQDLTQDFSGLTETFAEVKERFNPELTPQMVAESGAVANYPSSEAFKEAAARNSFAKE